MATSVTLPALGESVTEGTVTRWLKQPGEEVAVDEPLVEVSTDKVDTEIPSPAAGVLLEIKVGEDETVEVGTELALIGDASEAGGGDGQAESAEQGGEEAGAEPEQQAEPEQPEPEQAEPEQAEPEQAEPEQPEQERQVASQQQAAPQPEPEEQPTPKPAGGGGGGGTPVTLPALGESVTEGTVTRWLKSVGDEVAVDEPLLEVSTDKVDTEIPSPAAGVLVEIKVGEDETVEVGTELAVIGQPGEQPAEQPQEAAEPSATPQQAAAEAATPLEAEAREHAAAEAQSEAKSEQKDAASAGGPAPAQAPQAAPAQQQAVREEQTREERPQAPAEVASRDGETSQYVTPLVRRLAAEHGVDLSSVEGTGVGGRIRKQDVLAAAEAARRPAQPEAPAAPPAQPAPAKAPAPAAAASPLRGRTEKLSRLRATIARRMVESLQVSAQLTTVVEVDVTAISRLRQRAKRDFEAREGAKLSFLPFFAKTALEALKAHPKLNATLDTETGEVTYFDAEHLGVAVDTERGLLVPVIRDAGDLNIGGLARKIADLAERTRNNKIGPDDLSGGTFTLTNTGSRGALFDTPIINQPQVGIIGTGAVVKRPVVVTDADGADSIAIRSMVYLALTYDHRLVDGADAARFLTAVKQRLEGGQFEADLGL